MKFFKKFILWAFCLGLLAVLIPSVYLFSSIPRHEIRTLAKGYVEVEIKDKKASYKVVEKRPKDWVVLSKISPMASHAILISEDWGFYEHSGYDVEQIKLALDDTLNKGKRLRGASTISQQVVKNLFYDNRKSFVRKAKELGSTLYLEKYVEKKKILEVYLNIIEFGEGLYGIKGASRFYFGKTPDKLTAKQGAFLAMLLPSPKRYAHSFRKKKLTEYASKTIDDILHKMAVAGHISKDQLKDELTAPIHFRGTSKKKVEEFVEILKKPMEEIKEVVKKVVKKVLPKPKKIKKEKVSLRQGKIQAAPVSANPIEFDEDAIPEEGIGLEEEFSAD